MRILIVGCGYVGCELAHLLVAEGHAVWGMRRKLDPLPDGVESICADVTRPDSLRQLPDTIDAVVYTAAAGGFDETRYRTAYVDGPRNLFAALTKQGQHPRRILFASSTGVYAQNAGEWVDETSSAEPTHFSGTLLLEGERTVLNGPIPASIVRFAGIYGPGRTRLIENVRTGTATIPPTPMYMNHIHRDDCAGVLRHLLVMEAPDRIYIGTDNEPVERGEFLRWLAGRIGAPSPQFSATDEPISARAHRGNKRCSNRLLRAAGYVFTFPTFREGYGALLDSN